MANFFTECVLRLLILQLINSKLQQPLIFSKFSIISRGPIECPHRWYYKWLQKTRNIHSFYLFPIGQQHVKNLPTFSAKDCVLLEPGQPAVSILIWGQSFMVFLLVFELSFLLSQFFFAHSAFLVIFSNNFCLSVCAG